MSAPHPALVLEQELLTAEVRRDSARLAALLADEFLEFGASGKRWTKKDVIEALPLESGADDNSYEMGDIEVRQLAEGLVLITYRLDVTAKAARLRSSLRSSIWRLDAAWRMIFHQGTSIDMSQPD